MQCIYAFICLLISFNYLGNSFSAEQDRRILTLGQHVGLPVFALDLEAYVDHVPLAQLLQLGNGLRGPQVVVEACEERGNQF